MADAGIYVTSSAPDGGVTEKAAAPAAHEKTADGEIIIPDYDAQAPAAAPLAATSSASSAGSSTETYTIDEAIEAVGFGKFQIGVLLMAGLCWTADAMEMLLLSYIKQPLQCEWNITDGQAAIITSAVGFGMLLGSVTWGIVADGYGRRFGFLAVAAFTFGFGLVSAASVNYPMIVISRGLVGFGIGGVPVAFSLMMEFLPMAQRGTWGMGVVLFWSGGAIFEAVVAMYVMPTLGWRWLVAISSLPLGCLLALWPVLPESPRWLVGQGRLEEAQTVLERAAKVNGVALPPGKLSKEFEEIDDGHGSVGLDQIKPLLHPVIKPFTLRLWYLWFSCAFVYYGLVMVQPDMISMENKGMRCDYHVTAAAAGDAAAAPALADGSLVANIAGDVEGTVKFMAGEGDSVDIEVSVHYPDGTHAVTNDHKWHVHTDALPAPVTSGAQCSAAEGHWDPTGQEAMGNNYRCMPYDISKCFAGDLGGMTEPLQISGDVERMRSLNTPASSHAAHDALQFADLAGKSIVIHAADGGTPRIACGTIMDPNVAMEVDLGYCAGAMTASDYIDSLISTCGEFPGIIMTVLLIDILGRRPMLAYMYGICACAFVVIVPCIGRSAETAVFFVARGASNGFFQGVYLYTNELYPANVRATGMGMCSAVARVGLITTPFVAQTLDSINLTLASKYTSNPPYLVIYQHL